MINALCLKDIPSARVEEAYRVLRTNMQFCGFNDNIRSIAVASCSPRDGKTATSINLGISLAKSGKKVLLVDSDLRKPRLLKHLGNDCKYGLSSYLSGMVEMGKIINKTSLKNFFFVPCGPTPPNPAELLSSERFSAFLKAMRDAYDVILIDTPPLGSVIDCNVIAAQTDTAVIVAKSHPIGYSKAIKVREQLEKANVKILGLILNRANRSDLVNFRDSYHYDNFIERLCQTVKRLLKRNG